MADVAKSKAPNSPVAGQGDRVHLPDLNTGNTTVRYSVPLTWSHRADAQGMRSR